MIMLILPITPQPPSLLTFKFTVSSGFGLAVASHSIWRRVREKNQSASILYRTQFLTHFMALKLLLSAGMPTDRANDRWSSHSQQFGYIIWDTFFPIVKCPLVLAKKTPNQHNNNNNNKKEKRKRKKKKSLGKQSHFHRPPNELASKSQIPLYHHMRAPNIFFSLDTQIVWVKAISNWRVKGEERSVLSLRGLGYSY